MGYIKSNAIFSIVLGVIVVGFAVYFVFNSLVLNIGASNWRHFLWGAGAMLEAFAGVTNIVYGIKNLVKIKDKNKSNNRIEDYDLYE